MLLIGHTIEEMLMVTDTVIFLLQQLGFVLNLKKSENRVLRGDSRFINHDPVSTREESLKSSEAVSVDFRINKTNRVIVFNYSNSTSSTNKFQVPTTTTNTSIRNTSVILQKSDSKQKLQGITAVLDTKFENLQCLLLDSVSQ